MRQLAIARIACARPRLISCGHIEASKPRGSGKIPRCFPRLISRGRIDMSRKITHGTRDRYLTPEEGAKYQAIREQIEAEKPEIAARIKSRLEAMSSAQRVFQQLKQAREAKGLSLRDVQDITGIDASALSKLERGERENFTIDTVVRYAQAVGKQVELNVVSG